MYVRSSGRNSADSRRLSFLASIEAAQSSAQVMRISFFMSVDFERIRRSAHEGGFPVRGRDAYDEVAFGHRAGNRDVGDKLRPRRVHLNVCRDNARLALSKRSVVVIAAVAVPAPLAFSRQAVRIDEDHVGRTVEIPSRNGNGYLVALL